MKAARYSAALVAAVAATMMVFVGLVAASGDDIDLQGPVTAISAASISVQTAGGEKTAAINAQTEIFVGDSDLGVHGTVDDIEIGADVHVKAFQGTSGLVADEIEIESDDATSTPTATSTEDPTSTPTVTPTGTPDADGEVEFSGVIAEIRAGEIDIATGDGIRTALVDDTTIVRESGDPRTLDDLVVGQSVEVKGHDDGGSIVADRITIEDGDDDGDGDEFDVTGKVTEVGESSVTVDVNGEAMTFMITSVTEFDAEHDRSGSNSGPGRVTAHSDDDDDDDSDESDDDRTITDLKAGQWVRIEGRRQGADLVAEEIRILNDEFKDSAVEGTISAIDPGIITIDTGNGSKSFEVNSNTEVEHENGDDAAMGDLQVGQMVRIDAEDDTMDVAHHITILDGVANPHEDEDEIWGQVVSADVGAQTFDVKRGTETMTVIVASVTEITNADGSEAAFDAIVAGLFVKVHGTPVAGGFEAREIELFNEAHDAGIVKRVTSAGGGATSLRVILRAGGLRRVVLVDAVTKIVGIDGKRLPAGSIKEGAVIFVEASGRKLLDASRIVVATNRRGILRLTGNVTARVNNVIRVQVGTRLVALKLRPGTVVLLRNGRPVGLGALKVGAKVTVFGYGNLAGRFVTMVRIGG